MSLGQFKGFVLASKLDNRQTLLQINSFSSEYREQIVSKFHAIAKSIKTMELDPLPRKLRIFHLEKKKTRRHLMDKCTIRKKKLPEGTKAPVCEYHRAQSKKKRGGVIAATDVATTTIAAVKLVPNAQSHSRR